MIEIDRINKTFDEYVKGFDMNNKMISSKYNHTYRVCEQSKRICKSINLDEENTLIAYLIALLHDIGRFKQAKMYNSFNDANTIDHASLGCKILFEDKLIQKFISDRKYDDIIKKAILNHNKYSIEDCDGIELLHSKIIRDADKIDIIYNVANLGLIKLNEDDSDISTEVKNDFESEISVSHLHKKGKNDSILTMIAFVFDLNFNYSYEYFKSNNLINKIFKKLKNKSKFEYYIDKANKYIERKCLNVKQ